MGGGLEMLLSLWLMLEVCSLSGRVLYESLLVPVLMYGSNTMNDMEGEGDLGLGLPSMKRMYKVRNAQIREL